MYAFQASDPDSRPPPVSFSPPNAPPISAPDGPMLTLAIPQSEPLADMNLSASRTSLVKIEDERHGVVERDRLVEIAVAERVKDRRESLPQHRAVLILQFDHGRPNVESP